MLPAGLTAQPADREVHHRIRALHPTAQTVARLIVGACSCDLVRPRHEIPREDERHHRERHRKAGGGREPLLAAIERHRRGAGIPVPAGGWPRALAAFVAEHARNAGPTLYLLRFVTDAAAEAPIPDAPARPIRVADVRERPDSWLEEGVALVVVR
ncbi:MAG: hypothetical protein ACREOQ_20875 [Gemmatimonadales bacterium]